MGEFSRFVTQAFGFDDFVEAVMGALRDPRIEQHGAAGLRREPAAWAAAAALRGRGARLGKPPSSETLRTVSGDGGASPSLLGAKPLKSISSSKMFGRAPDIMPPAPGAGRRLPLQHVDRLRRKLPGVVERRLHVADGVGIEAGQGAPE